MSTNLMWLLYFGDVVHGLSVISALVLFLGLVAFLMWGIFATTDDDPPRYPTSATVATVFAAAVLIVVPSKQTIYASAAIYVTGEAASTEEFVLVREILKRELKKMVEEK